MRSRPLESKKKIGAGRRHSPRVARKGLLRYRMIICIINATSPQTSGIFSHVRFQWNIVYYETDWGAKKARTIILIHCKLVIFFKVFEIR